MSYVIENNNKLIVIPHIPKTAGCAVGKYLENNFNFIYGQSEQPSWENCSELSKRINGHNRVQECQNAIVDFYGDALKEKETILISIIRNPWSWWKSWFYFISKIVHTDSDFLIEFKELYSKRDVDIETFFLWMKENKHRSVFKNTDMNTMKYDQMVNWLKPTVFDFDRTYVCETHEVGKRLPEIFSDLGFGFTNKVELDNQSKSIDYNNNQFYNEKTRKLVEDFHKEDIIEYRFKWDICKDYS